MQQLALADGPVLARFMEKIRINPETGCWEWQGAQQHCGGKARYGFFWFNGRSDMAHRVAYQLLVGPIPDGFYIDHLCGNKPCVNSAHLEAVSPQLNTLRSPHCAVTHCPQGHPYDDDNTYIRPDGGHRDCRECMRIYNRLYRARTQGAAV